MKIVHACGWYFPDSLGGTEAYVAAVCRRLRDAGHSVFIAAPDAGGVAQRSYMHEGVPVFRYSIPARPTRAETQGMVPTRGSEHLHRWLAEVRPDVLHVHTFVTGLGLHEIEAGLDAGARVIATTHAGSLGFLCQRGTMMRWGRRVCDGYVSPAKCAACELQHRGVPRPLAGVLSLIPPSVGQIGRRLPGKLGTGVGMTDLIERNQERQRDLMRRVSRFVVLSDWAREAVLANGAPPDRVAVNRLGVRCTTEESQRWRAIPKTRNHAITVAYIGRFEAIKGVHDLARAVAWLPADLPLRVQFRGPVTTLQDLAVVDELKRIVGMQRWVEFREPVAPDAVFEALRDVDVVVCPSRCVEGGPTVALEAQATGTPVIGTRVAALTEIVRDGVNGRLVAPGDWRALAQLLTQIARNPAATVDEWRTALPAIRTMDDVTRDYLKWYTA